MFQDFSIFNSGVHFVQPSGTILGNYGRGSYRRNNCVKRPVA